MNQYEAEMRTLLQQCSDVAKGARFYVDNFGDCGDVPGGKESFATACFGLIAFTLDAIDAHFCELEDVQIIPSHSRLDDIKLTFDYSKPAKE